jgi:predicted nucleotidyltransferase
MPATDALGQVGFPTERHAAVLQTVLAALDADDNVRGVLLGGSLARSTAREDSDLDVMVVVAEERGLDAWRHDKYDLPTDVGVRTVSAWESTFAPDRVGDESWGYAFLDGVILRDPDRCVAGLIARAAEIHAAYRTPPSIPQHYRRLWSHVRPKMRAVLGRGDPVEIGWAGAVMMDDVMRTAWAVNDRPNPSLDLGTVQRHLDDLRVPEGVSDRLRDILRQTAGSEMLGHQLSLVRDFELELLAALDDGHQAPGTTSPPPTAAPRP